MIIATDAEHVAYYYYYMVFDVDLLLNYDGSCPLIIPNGEQCKTRCLTASSLIHECDLRPFAEHCIATLHPIVVSSVDKELDLV